MTSYRRLRRTGATYFFTVCVEDRGSRILTDNLDLLRAAYRATVQEFPVECRAMVVLPDHLHVIWTEPEGEVCFPERWRRLKARFSHAVAGTFAPSDSKRAKRERGLWQRRYWEHLVRDAGELAAAVEYCRMDPVAHGLVRQPMDWPHSSFARRRVAGPEPGSGDTAAEDWRRRMGNIAHPTCQA